MCHKYDRKYAAMMMYGLCNSHFLTAEEHQSAVVYLWRSGKTI